MTGGRVERCTNMSGSLPGRGSAGGLPRGQRLRGGPLSQRPAHIATRRQLGHWEIDTLLGTSRRGSV
jgi:IS30 family transposase